MRRISLHAILYLLTFGIAKADPDKAKSKFAHFLEPGFPFAEIVVDARELGEGFPKDNLTPRGLVIRLAEDTYIAYDTDLCRVACAWTGGFLTEESLATKSYQKAKKKKDGGQGVLPEPIGKPIFANGLYPGVQLGGEPLFEDPRPAGKNPAEIGRGALPQGMARWDFSAVFGKKMSVDYNIGKVRISELPWSLRDGVIVRYFSVADHPDEDLSIVLGSGHCEIIEPPEGCRINERDGVNYLTLPRTADGFDFAVVQSAEKIEGKLPGGTALDEWFDEPDQWQDFVKTSGTLAADESDYVVDRIPLPLDNPERRNIRPVDIDFFPGGGSAAVVTFDGDVWQVWGLHGDLQDITWKRLAGGLHEPNSVSIRNGQIFVFGRNGITRIERGSDEPGAKFDEDLFLHNFCSDFWQSAETRDFAQSMDIASDGSYFVTKGGQQNDLPSKHSGRTLKISADGKNVSVFASGFRNAYLTIRPGTDEVYASDQQGHWVPATPIHRIVEGGYYGFQPAAPWGVPEPPITPPLCWIPHAVAGSGLGPVWSDKKRFGPLSDSLVYLDFQRPGLLRTYLNERKGQAATVPMPLEFDFPLLKGAVNPLDGQLYLVGFQIWGTSAKKIRGIARVRYTGKPSFLPTRVIAGKNAITLTFDQALDPTVADFTVRRWNYQRSSSYGSGHYRPDGKAGEEILAIGGSEFSKDERSVLIATPDLEPVHQLAISYRLKTETGQDFTNAAYLTLHETSPLDLDAEGFPDIDLKKLVAQSSKAKDVVEAKPSIERGSVLHQTIGCAGCHSVDGTNNGKSGPTWKGLAGSQRALLGGATAVATADYLRESILDPAAKINQGYNPKDVGMPSYRGILSDSDVESLILFIQSLEK